MTRREASAAAAATLAGLLALPGPAAARGRATQVKTWARYGSRVETTRSWMAGTFQGYVKSGDFASMKADTDPKKVSCRGGERVRVRVRVRAPCHRTEPTGFFSESSARLASLGPDQPSLTPPASHTTHHE